ncbi:MAG: ABC transporter ATP-binding protein [Gammaproteobacteria bacterium]|nr:ABC transporter ATP-binding protein [Gammaproteobacteria bacterium]
MLLEIEDLRLSRSGTEVLKGVNLAFERGEIYGFLGPNGAGKSTTVAAAVGLLAAEHGTIQVLGSNGRHQDPQVRAQIGVLPEQNGFYDWMTAESYLSFYAALHGRTFNSPQLVKRLAQVGLVPRAGQLIGTYSRGMRQRLGIARALINDPKLLILDEPTNGLDPRGRREIHDILLALAASGVGVLMCTHLLDDVERLCQRVGILVDGRTVAEGKLAELVQSSDHRTRFRLRLSGALPEGSERIPALDIIAREGDWLIVDIAADKPSAQVWRELLFSAWPIDEIHRDDGGLEALYLALTAGSNPS